MNVLPSTDQFDDSLKTATKWTFYRINQQKLTSTPNKKKRSKRIMSKKATIEPDDKKRESSCFISKRQDNVYNNNATVIKRTKCGDQLSNERKLMNRRAIIYISNNDHNLSLNNILPNEHKQQKDDDLLLSLYCLTQQKLRKNTLPLLESIHLQQMLRTLEQQSDTSFRLKHNRHFIQQTATHSSDKQPAPTRSSSFQQRKQSCYKYEEEDNIPLVKLLAQQKGNNTKQRRKSEEHQYNNNYQQPYYSFLPPVSQATTLFHPISNNVFYCSLPYWQFSSFYQQHFHFSNAYRQAFSV
ncbi:uncharacterized protein BX663DRAFT_505649 [Cokeromyces recurvatus]|uniref:uncharacterized protein n=1 Tax=Cokeromyces recurvatus TaxID=90255 RepID=UPI00221EA402|nr:uncharacterized protein BX663DRAFT_505649 [Cokeromyces recurvatus]KAI7903904.1 hypothetical protein BX663DRAFT_505649 [Cokeromyces recurvatus]